VIAQQIDLEDCTPSASAFGSSLLVSYCTSFDEADLSGSSELDQLDDAGARTTLVTGSSFAPQITVDATRSHLFTIDEGTGGVMFDTSGLKTVIDPKAILGVFAPDGALIYSTYPAALRRWDAHSGMTVLATLSGQGFIDMLSPDGNTALLTESISTAQNVLGEDVWTAPARVPGAEQPILQNPTGWPIGFTADSQYALYLSPVGQNLIGPLHASKMGAGDHVFADAVAQAMPTHDSHLVACAGNDLGGKSCDLVEGDAGGVGKLLSKSAVTYDLVLGGKKLFWSVKDAADPKRDGIWVVDP
jgi:hypothetical protein